MVMPTVRMMLVGLGAAAYAALRFWVGGFAAFFSRPALIALLVVLLALSAASQQCGHF